MKFLILVLSLTVFGLVSISCQNTTPVIPVQEEPQSPQTPSQPPSAPTTPSVPAKGAVDCSVVETTEQLSTGIKQLLPAELFSIAESHYISKQDGWMGPATSETDKIAAHIALSKAYLKKTYGLTDAQLTKAYSPHHATVWNGGDGAGPIGLGGFVHAPGMKNVRPELDAEIFQMNMYWVMTNGPNGTILSPYAPPYPTKYITSYKGKHVVVSAGYEQGPPLKHGRLGLSPETYYFLGAPNEMNKTKVAIGRLKNQNLPYGPVDCK